MPKEHNMNAFLAEIANMIAPNLEIAIGIAPEQCCDENQIMEIPYLAGKRDYPRYRFDLLSERDEAYREKYTKGWIAAALR